MLSLQVIAFIFEGGTTLIGIIRDFPQKERSTKNKRRLKEGEMLLLSWPPPKRLQAIFKSKASKSNKEEGGGRSNN